MRLVFAFLYPIAVSLQCWSSFSVAKHYIPKISLGYALTALTDTVDIDTARPLPLKVEDKLETMRSNLRRISYMVLECTEKHVHTDE